MRLPTHAPPTPSVTSTRGATQHEDASNAARMPPVASKRSCCGVLSSDPSIGVFWSTVSLMVSLLFLANFCSLNHANPCSYYRVKCQDASALSDNIHAPGLCVCDDVCRSCAFNVSNQCVKQLAHRLQRCVAASQLSIGVSGPMGQMCSLVVRPETNDQR